MAHERATSRKLKLRFLRPLLIASYELGKRDALGENRHRLHECHAKGGLTSLDLNDNDLDSAGAAALVPALSTMTHRGLSQIQSQSGVNCTTLSLPVQFPLSAFKSRGSGGGVSPGRRGQLQYPSAPSRRGARGPHLRTRPGWERSREPLSRPLWHAGRNSCPRPGQVPSRRASGPGGPDCPASRESETADYGGHCQWQCRSESDCCQ